MLLYAAVVAAVVGDVDRVVGVVVGCCGRRCPWRCFNLRRFVPSAFIAEPPRCSLDVTPPREELLGPDRHSLVQVAVSRDVVDQVEGLPLHSVLVRRSGLTLVLL